MYEVILEESGGLFQNGNDEDRFPIGILLLLDSYSLMFISWKAFKREKSYLESLSAINFRKKLQLSMF